MGSNYYAHVNSPIGGRLLCAVGYGTSSKGKMMCSLRNHQWEARSDIFLRVRGVFNVAHGWLNKGKMIVSSEYQARTVPSLC